MKKRLKKFFLVAIVIITLILIGTALIYFLFLKPDPEQPDFETDTLFLKVVIVENGTSLNEVKISNTNHIDEHFLIRVLGLGEIVSLAKPEFTLSPEEESRIEVFFNAEGKEPGVYLGGLEISARKSKKTIPIILEIQTEEVLFDANVNLYPPGKEVIPGQRLNLEMKIFDLGAVGKSKLGLNYFIRSFDGRSIFSDSEEIVVEGRLDFSKTIDIPKNIKLGNYVLYSVLKYENSTATTSTFFSVVSKQTAEQKSENFLIYLIIALFCFFFLIFLIFFIYSVCYRDRVLRELQDSYRRELARQRRLIGERIKIDSPKLTAPAEKREYNLALKKIRNERLKILKDIQAKRVKEYKILKKKGKTPQLKSQIAKWKTQGYDTSVLERKYKFPSVSDIKKKVAEWKKKGYDTGVLDKRIK